MIELGFCYNLSPYYSGGNSLHLLLVGDRSDGSSSFRLHPDEGKSEWGDGTFDFREFATTVKCLWDRRLAHPTTARQ
ncbi:MAG: hypothetical protein ACM37W_21640 [Actinomycetota bacterium]